MLPHQVLIVEDDPHLAKSLCAAAEGNEFAFVLAHDGRGAMRSLDENDVDIVVIDVGLPDVDGLELMRRVRRQSSPPEVLVITGGATQEIAVACLRAGAADMLQKPFSADEFLHALRRAVRLAELGALAEVHAAAKDMLVAVEPNELARGVLDAAIRAVRADDAALMVSIQGTGRYQVFKSGAAEPFTSRGGESVARRVSELGKPCIINGPASADPRFAGLPTSPRVKASLVYPIGVGERGTAVLIFNRTHSDEPFRRRDLARPALLATHTRLAFDHLIRVKNLAAVERLAAMGELMASVTHELNNPLSFIASNIDFIHQTLDQWSAQFPDAARTFPADVRAALSDAREGATRVTSLVADMKGLSRADSSGTSVFDVREALSAALRLSAAELYSATKHIDAPEPVWARGNPGRLSQVFINLLVNAAHAMAGMEPSRQRLSVRVTREGESALIRVEDAGPGISADVLARIFEPFFTTKAARGTGLGLPISRDIVERMGGKLDVETTLGRGTTFTVRLPAALAPGAEAGPGQGQQSPAGGE